ncbi:MAG: endospore germination permease [Bacillota bacterium]
MRLTSEKISNRQLFFILFMMRTTIVISFLPVLTSADALQDAWASSILSFGGAGLGVCLIAGLGIRFPHLTGIQYSQKLLGKWGGKAVSLPLVLLFIYIASSDVRIYAEAISIGFLRETPLTFIITVMVIAGTAAARAGIEVIGRAADILFPLFLLVLVLTLLFPLPDLRALAVNLEPVLARGAGPVLRGAVVPTVMIAQYLVLIMLIPTLTQPRRALATSLWALAGSTFMLTLVAAMVAAILGPDRGSRSIFPFFVMVRTLQISEFLERVEILTMFAWGFGLFIGLSVILLCATWGVAQLLGVRAYRPLVGPVAVICVVLSVHSYRDIMEFRTFFTPPVAAPFASVGMLLPLAILWLAYLGRRMTGWRPGDD